MDITQQYVLAGFVLIGFVNGASFAFDKQWKSFGLFMTAVLAGMVFGYLKWFGLPSAEIGLAVGLGSSGIFKVAQKVGGN